MLRSAVALLGVLLAQSPRGGPAGPQEALLPPVAMEAATRGAIPLAYVLARFGVPTGIVTTENPSDVAFAWTVPRLDEPRSVTAREAAARLMGAHPRYIALWDRGVLQMREQGSLCAEAVTQPIAEPIVLRTDLSRALVMIGWLASGKSGTPAGSISGPPSVSTGAIAAPPAALPEVGLTIGGGSPMSLALDRAVLAARGGVWIVWQHDTSDTRTGCRVVGYYPNGQVGASRSDFKVLDRHQARLVPSVFTAGTAD